MGTIHLIHLSSAPGGIEVLLPEMICKFTECEFRVFVVRPPEKNKQNVYSGMNVPICTGSKNNISACWKLFRYAREAKHEIFHAFNIGPFFLLALRIAGAKKVVYSIHGTVYWRHQWQKTLLRLLWRVALRPQYVLIANSLFSSRVFSDQVLSRKDIRLIYNPINPERFRFSPKEKILGKLRLVSVGRLAKGKNLDTCIAMVANLKSYFPGMIYEIYGQGPEREPLLREIKKRDLSGTVVLKGYINDVQEAYYSADVLLFLSERESFGNVVVESILCGTPVIAGDIPSMREIFSDFPQFLVSPEGDVAESVRRKLIEVEKLRLLVPAVRVEFLERFSYDDHISRLKKIYELF